MPDEQKDESQLEAEMLRLMAQQEGETPPTPSNDVEAAMLQMLQGTEQAGDAGATAGDSQKDLDSMLGAGIAGTAAPALSAPPPAFGPALDIPTENVNRLLNVRLTVSIELGRVQIPIRDIIGWTEGSLVELDKIAGEPVDVLVNGKLFARGEVVVIAENFGVRITQMLNPADLMN
ncbi:MAG: flagellar motor switch protein FliN [Candidatus Handelsmanbacteria bacterium RIFCSPLOWO2_12_FULL_64_10]|uniref:Flagellar motor switch protein FliN n=1 Tax=Handelsmanbacteria sp. (strain RIFCSPLOWO2_12_FULL_64_10) TaxID=1817868 RepID=A0A1F6D3L5_HANXR|nr:MAG: flagellar motor switch protein FliN [Candidatus Handelsmanbacteria bacterium RIFCSPLOWO2_12_FULL_64_10]